MSTKKNTPAPSIDQIAARLEALEANETKLWKGRFSPASLVGQTKGVLVWREWRDFITKYAEHLRGQPEIVPAKYSFRGFADWMTENHPERGAAFVEAVAKIL